MMTAALVILTVSSPVLLVVALLGLAAWRDRRRETVIARQIRLTDALADQVGPIVAPLVSKPFGRPWRVDVQVPVARPNVVSRVVTIAHETLTRMGAERYELVLTPAPAPVQALGTASRPARRLQAA